MPRPQFGKDRDPGIVAEMAGEKSVDGTPLHNPCITAFGPGPKDTKCKSCALLSVAGGTERNYYKCALRGNSHSATTDHRMNWPACAKWQAITGDVFDG